MEDEEEEKEEDEEGGKRENFSEPNNDEFSIQRA